MHFELNNGLYITTDRHLVFEQHKKNYSKSDSVRQRQSHLRLECAFYRTEIANRISMGLHHKLHHLTFYVPHLIYIQGGNKL